MGSSGIMIIASCTCYSNDFINIFMFSEDKLSFIRKNLRTTNITKLIDNWLLIIANFEDVPYAKKAKGKR